MDRIGDYGSSDTGSIPVRGTIIKMNNMTKWPSGRRRQSAKLYAKAHRKFESCLGHIFTIYKFFMVSVAEWFRRKFVELVYDSSILS